MMMEEFLGKFCPGLSLERAVNIMHSPHATIEFAYNDDYDEIVGGIFYMSFEELRFSIIGVLAGERVDDLITEVPDYDAVYAPFQFDGATEVIPGWWRRGPEQFDKKDMVTPIYLYFQAFKAVDDVLNCPEFTQMVTPIYNQ